MQRATAPCLADRYRAVRERSVELTRSLVPEDMVVSSMPDVSPTKWHLAHTSWFFESFVLTPHDRQYVSPNSLYSFLFNSYYVQAGERHCRAQRGLVTRPTVAEVLDYRRHVDRHVIGLLERCQAPTVERLVELGLHHEQQHQELMLTDIKHVFWTNPLKPSFAHSSAEGSGPPGPEGWTCVPEGIYTVGHVGAGFAFDNESPAHRVFIDEFRISNRLVTNGDFMAFMDDRGFRRADLWLAAGWALVRAESRRAPLYWSLGPDGWTEFTLAGERPVDPMAPLCNVSYFEADAFARWSGHRLPTEEEWEIAATLRPDTPQLFESRWQWTKSAYVAYPGYHPAPGAVGEYNGKWMSDQWVLRGSSFATPSGHERVTYRNFFPSDTRWQFTGIRLAAP